MINFPKILVVFNFLNSILFWCPIFNPKSLTFGLIWISGSFDMEIKFVATYPNQIDTKILLLRLIGFSKFLRKRDLLVVSSEPKMDFFGNFWSFSPDQRLCYNLIRKQYRDIFKPIYSKLANFPKNVNSDRFFFLGIKSLSFSNASVFEPRQGPLLLLNASFSARSNSDM